VSILFSLCRIDPSKSFHSLYKGTRTAGIAMYIIALYRILWWEPVSYYTSVCTARACVFVRLQCSSLLISE